MRSVIINYISYQIAAHDVGGPPQLESYADVKQAGEAILPVMQTPGEEMYTRPAKVSPVFQVRLLRIREWPSQVLICGTQGTSTVLLPSRIPR